MAPAEGKGGIRPPRVWRLALPLVVCVSLGKSASLKSGAHWAKTGNRTLCFDFLLVCLSVPWAVSTSRTRPGLCHIHVPGAPPRTCHSWDGKWGGRPHCVPLGQSFRLSETWVLVSETSMSKSCFVWGIKWSNPWTLLSTVQNKCLSLLLVLNKW